MRRFPVFVPILLIVALAIVIGVLLGLFTSKPPPPAPVVPTVVETGPKETKTNADHTANTESPITETNQTEAPTTAQTWDDRLNDILADDKIDEAQKADKLADMIQNLPENAQVEIAGHLANLVSDEDYAKKTSALVKNDKLPASVTSVLMTDLYNRDDELSLPLFLEIAQNEKHPLKDEARENLEQRLTEDHGTNWVEWKSAVDNFLKTP